MKGKQLSVIIQKKARAKHYHRAHTRSPWMGLSLMGVIGWSVSVPTLLGVALGVWIDANYASPYSWTLMLLIAGAAIGCFNALYWVRREHKEIGKEREK